MKTRRWITIGILALIAMMLVVTPVAAQSTRIEFTAREFTCSEGPPGKIWFSEDGTILHIREQTRTGENISDEPLATGTNSIVMNMDLDLLTGEGHAYGTFSLDVSGVEGTWDGHWTLHIYPDGFWGTSNGHGTGDLDGMKLKSELTPWDPGDPDNPCETMIGADFVSGYILNPFGD